MRQTARDIFTFALEQSSVAAAFERSVHCSRGILQIGEDLYNLADFSRIYAVAFGKAAHTMARELRLQLGAQVTGIVSAPPIHDAQIEGFRYFTGGHPYPDKESVLAADAILKSLRTLGEKSLVIYLISGGGSSLIEKPIDNEISLDDLITTYRVLVHSGAPIAEINTIRKHLSAVKGGRMAQAAAAKNARQVSIMISDVPDNTLDSLASGPTMPDTSSVEDCYVIAEKYSVLEKFATSVRELFERKTLEETPDKDDPLFHYSRWWPILSNANAVKSAAEKAKSLGFAVTIDNSCDDHDYVQAADYLLNRLRDLQCSSPRVCLISGGEVTVQVAEKSGTGGRNQQFALYCGSRITAENITVLSAGTDGIDGNTPAAGAVADGETTQRHSLIGTGQTISAALKTFDAHPFFAQLGDAIVTGPTGNNIRDLRILLAY